MPVMLFFFFFNCLLIIGCAASLLCGLSLVVEVGLLFLGVHRFLNVVASFAAEHMI